ncbi:MAG: glycosyltransferase family 39 protein [Anaerolineae bacterium]|nr:glycosyltransferase family 39 protein [Anaerolineae bacterium]
MTIDEPLFLDHARQFAAGLSSGKLSQTLGIGYPGVTVAWWSAPVIGLASTELGAYIAGRVMTSMMTGLLLLGVYGLANSLWGRRLAFIGTSLLALDPYTLAYCRLLHIAAPLALFMTLAGLAGLLWLRDKRWRWLLLTGLFTGLALLTKSTALLLGPMLAVLVLGWGIGTGQGQNWSWWWSKLGGWLIIALVAMATFFMLWPAMWADPVQALTLTFKKLFTDQEAGTGNLGFFWLGRFVEDPGPAFYLVAFLLKSTPWLLIGLFLNLGFFISASRSFLTLSPPQSAGGKQRSIRGSQPYAIQLSLWLFALTYLILMTLASKKSIRYMLPIFPTFYLLASWALYQISQSAGQQAGSWRRKLFFCLLPPVSCLLLIFTFVYHPYYFTYYNPLVLGWRWAPQTLLVGWGEGLDEAARYVQQQSPGSVSAWYKTIFSTFYEDQVDDVVPPENLLTANRTVWYINQVQRDIPNPNLVHYFRTRRQPEYTAKLNGIEYAWVYPGPIVSLNRPDPTLQYPLGGEFGNELRLLGYNLSPHPRFGDPLMVTFFWRVLASPPAERFVYLRLLDAQGHVWAQADSPPVMGLWPVDRWQPGMLIEDAQELSVPPGMPAGMYRLEVGLYDPASGQVLPAGGQPVGQGGGLLLGDVQIEWQLLRVESDLPQKTDTRLAPNARLIGYDAPPAVVTAGDVLPLRLAWRESQTLPALWAVPNDFVMFEWQPVDRTGSSTEQLEKLPRPIAEWGRGAILLSQHNVSVYPTLEAGQYNLRVRLHSGSEPAGEAFSLGRVEVIHPPHQFDLPATALTPAGPNQVGESITLLGYGLHLTDQSLDLNLYWQTDDLIATGYKVFAQLLTPDNTLAVQADSFPAAGQRPTTGWLPGEIITDPHPLLLPADLPAGTYQLITGLYNPTTGERLPILNKNGEIVADAIFVTKVTIP